jgi:hypothetical protein
MQTLPQCEDKEAMNVLIKPFSAAATFDHYLDQLCPGGGKYELSLRPPQVETTVSQYTYSCNWSLWFRLTLLK